MKPALQKRGATKGRRWLNDGRQGDTQSGQRDCEEYGRYGGVLSGLGCEIDAEAGAFHVGTTLPNGMRLDFDSTSFVRQWDNGWSGATGGSTVLGFGVASRDGVDALYGELVAAGYRGRQRPYDAFWGAR